MHLHSLANAVSSARVRVKKVRPSSFYFFLAFARVRRWRLAKTYLNLLNCQAEVDTEGDVAPEMFRLGTLTFPGSHV
jgi:hypothetical protein